MSNIFSDWLNGPDSPIGDDINNDGHIDRTFDEMQRRIDHGTDDYAGVVRWDGKRKSRGDRDDLEAKREKDEIEESIKRLKQTRRNFDLLYQQQLSEPRKPRRDEVEAKRLSEARKSLDERRMQTARDEAQRGNYGRDYDPISGTTAGYVAPHERHSNGYAFLALVVAMCGLVIMALTGG